MVWVRDLQYIPTEVEYIPGLLAKVRISSKVKMQVARAAGESQFLWMHFHPDQPTNQPTKDSQLLLDPAANHPWMHLGVLHLFAYLSYCLHTCSCSETPKPRRHGRPESFCTQIQNFSWSQKFHSQKKKWVWKLLCKIWKLIQTMLKVPR